MSCGCLSGCVFSVGVFGSLSAERFLRRRHRERRRAGVEVGSAFSERRAATSAMAAGASRVRADYDYLIKLLWIGDSGMSLSSLVHAISKGCAVLQNVWVGFHEFSNWEGSC